MKIADRLASIRQTIPEEVTLVAVSKFHPVDVLRKAYDCGQRVFGESRVQELMAKQPVLPADIEWHFIGTLQTNKVKYIAPFIHLIQSIDSLKLLAAVDKEAQKCGRQIRVLIEVHIAEEASKHGFTPDECRTLFAEGTFSAYPHIRVVGLMGMATFTDDEAQVRREFRELRSLFDELRILPSTGDDFKELSMGMSDDYPLALQEGSTMVRVGTKIFGERVY
ncbi:YggS family pyridoxal phosphate-dependent enzyme [Tannerella sp.]|uniref:YggS family pyridoxal phosphate-dependent enzyme n=1 Tax=Tannerella sp. TaxID=2382127 RepID=UPI0026DAFF60|nr:YggS family pyridoxal phosphate-dependent enzyme [Tannerella sp.]MDO4702871.1 YggS family pyridoxal phosphate-dependent enzyme [Tannerella sp.]